MSADPHTGIQMYFHCRKCVAAKPPDTTPRDWARTEMGVSPEGDLIVWCIRHEGLIARLSNATLSQTLRGFTSSQCEGPHESH